MDDLASKLGELLNNPGTLEQIKGLAGLFGGAAPGSTPIPGPLPSAGPLPVSAPPPEHLESPADGEMLRTMMKMAPLLSAFRQEDDSTRLLHALRPMLSPERQKKLDEAIKLIQLMRVLPLLKGSGLLGLF